MIPPADRPGALPANGPAGVHTGPPLRMRAPSRRAPRMMPHPVRRGGYHPLLGPDVPAVGRDDPGAPTSLPQKIPGAHWAPGIFLCAYSAGTKVSTNRMRMVAISARVADPWGVRVVAEVPEISPAFTAQSTAETAQLEMLS